MCIPFPETWEFEKDLRSLFTSRDFRRRRAMILKVERNIKTRENRGNINSTTCEYMFHQLAVKNVKVNVVITIYCQHNSIFLRQKIKL